MKRWLNGASGTADDTGDSCVALNVRVRVYPGTDREVSFEAPLPADFERALAVLRAGAQSR